MTDTATIHDFPLYDPRTEHDACGVGFIVNVNGDRSHSIIRQGIEILVNLTHRGACGCDPETGDGAGVTIQIPHSFFARVCATNGFSLPEEGSYGVGMVFLPVEPQSRFQCQGILDRMVLEEGLSVLGWRDTPVDGDAIGRTARASQPYIEQIFIERPAHISREDFDRKLFIVRRKTELAVAASNIPEKKFFSVPSMSSWTASR